MKPGGDHRAPKPKRAAKARWEWRHADDGSPLTDEDVRAYFARVPAGDWVNKIARLKAAGVDIATLTQAARDAILFDAWALMRLKGGKVAGKVPWHAVVRALADANPDKSDDEVMALLDVAIKLTNADTAPTKKQVIEKLECSVRLDVFEAHVPRAAELDDLGKHDSGCGSEGLVCRSDAHFHVRNVRGYPRSVTEATVLGIIAEDRKQRARSGDPPP